MSARIPRPHEKTLALSVLAVILTLGAILRLSAAVTAPLNFLEDVEFIPGALSLSEGHYPVRLSQHGALPVYLIRLSGLVFGESVLGMRALSVVVGIATILLLYLMAARWWGRGAGLIAASLLAVERYHVAITARAVDLGFDFFFTALSLYAFSRFLHGSREDASGAGRWLYTVAAASALAFLCKELAGLLVPAFGLSLLVVRRGEWFRRRELWLAVALFAMLITPDLLGNMVSSEAERADLRNRYVEFAVERDMALPPEHVRNGVFMTYGDQLSRFDGFGFNPTPFYFYLGDVLTRIGFHFENLFDEFPSLHPLVGIGLLIGVLVALLWRKKDELRLTALVLFFTLFLPFAVVEVGMPRGQFASDSAMLFYWVDRTMLPALLLLSLVLSRALNGLRSQLSR